MSFDTNDGESLVEVVDTEMIVGKSYEVEKGKRYLLVEEGAEDCYMLDVEEKEITKVELE
jgi:hypothetical protein